MPILKENRTSPKFIDEAEQFTIVVFGEDIITTKDNGGPKDLTSRESSVLSLFKINPTVTNKAIQALGLSKTQAQVVLKALLDKGIIVQHGKGRSTYYMRAERMQTI